MLDVTNELANRYHIKLGNEKSQILTIGKTTGHTNLRNRLVDMELADTETYMYMGMTMNTKGNLADHINKLKIEQRQHSKTSLAGYLEFNNIHSICTMQKVN